MRDCLTRLVDRHALLRDSRGITALEYGLIASALALVLVGIFTRLGTPLSSIFYNVGSSL